MRVRFLLNVLYYSIARPIIGVSFVAASVFLISSSSCSSVRKNPKIHEDFIPYIDGFIEDSGGSVKWKNLKDYNIQYVPDISNSIIGLCDRRNKELLINKKYWNSSSTMELERKALIYHELAHCILNRNHTQPHLFPYDWITKYENLMLKLGKWKQIPPLADGCDGSLMHPSTGSYACLVKHWDYYVHELFQNDERGAYVIEKDNMIVRQEESCPAPEIINETDTWTEDDDEIVKITTQRCKEMYNTCLKTLYKRGELEYGAVCY